MSVCPWVLYMPSNPIPSGMEHVKGQVIVNTMSGEVFVVIDATPNAQRFVGQAGTQSFSTMTV